MVKENSSARPSQSVVRAVQVEIDGHMDDKSRLVSDCDAWRDKYRMLVRERDALLEENRRLKESSAM